MEHGHGQGDGNVWQRRPEQSGPPAWDIVLPDALPPVQPAAAAWAEPALPPRRRTGLLVAAVTVGALAIGVLAGAVGGVQAADDQERVDALSGQVTELEAEVAGLDDEVAGLENEVTDTREQAAEDVAAARGEAEAAVAAENASTVAEMDARAAQLDAREAAVAAREDAATVLEQQAADGSIPGSGVHLVGEEIAPGTYRASTPQNCYWERLSGLSGEFGDIIANGIGAGDSTVTIRGSDVAFASERCGTWARIS